MFMGADLISLPCVGKEPLKSNREVRGEAWCVGVAGVGEGICSDGQRQMGVKGKGELGGKERSETIMGTGILVEDIQAVFEKHR